MIDQNLHFDEYILSQCKKTGRKLSVLVRICKFMTIEHGRKPLLDLNLVIVLFYNRSCNNRINHLRALRIVYNGNISSFEDLLQRDQTVSIDYRNIRLLGIELCKIRNNISSHMNDE